MAATTQEVIDCIQLFTVTSDVSAKVDGIAFKYEGDNRIDLFDDLAEMGWRVTSLHTVAGDTVVWINASDDDYPRQ